MSFLIEQPNTSYMYQRLFPNWRLRQKLEELGYTFQMGNGLKIYRKHHAAANRGSGPVKRRQLQTIVIFKNGQFFRKVPKAKWTQTIDPSDKDSPTWGTAFMEKLYTMETGQPSNA